MTTSQLAKSVFLYSFFSISISQAQTPADIKPNNPVAQPTAIPNSTQAPQVIHVEQNQIQAPAQPQIIYIERPAEPAQPLYNTNRAFFKNSNKTNLQPLRIGAYYSRAKDIHFDEIDITSGTDRFEGHGNFYSDDSYGLSLEYFHPTDNDLTWSFGLAYEAEREIGKADIKIDGASGTLYPDGESERFRLFISSINGIYKLNDLIYVQTGFNYNYAVIDGASPSTRLRGDLGYQAGIGLNIHKHLIVDVIYRLIALKARTHDSANDVTIEYFRGHMSGFQLGVKFAF